MNRLTLGDNLGLGCARIIGEVEGDPKLSSFSGGGPEGGLFPLVRLKKEGIVDAESVVERKKEEKGDETGAADGEDVAVVLTLGVFAGAARELAGGNVSAANGESVRLTFVVDKTESEVAGETMELSEGALLAKKLGFFEERKDPTLVARDDALDPASFTPASTAVWSFSCIIAARAGRTYHA